MNSATVRHVCKLLIEHCVNTLSYVYDTMSCITHVFFCMALARRGCRLGSPPTRVLGDLIPPAASRLRAAGVLRPRDGLQFSGWPENSGKSSLLIFGILSSIFRNRLLDWPHIYILKLKLTTFLFSASVSLYPGYRIYRFERIEKPTSPCGLIRGLKRVAQGPKEFKGTKQNFGILK